MAGGVGMQVCRSIKKAGVSRQVCCSVNQPGQVCRYAGMSFGHTAGIDREVCLLVKIAGVAMQVCWLGKTAGVGREVCWVVKTAGIGRKRYIGRSNCWGRQGSMLGSQTSWDCSEVCWSVIQLV